MTLAINKIAENTDLSPSTADSNYDAYYLNHTLGSDSQLIMPPDGACHQDLAIDEGLLKFERLVNPTPARCQLDPHG